MTPLDYVITYKDYKEVVDYIMTREEKINFNEWRIDRKYLKQLLDCVGDRVIMLFKFYIYIKKHDNDIDTYTTNLINLIIDKLLEIARREENHEN